MPNTKDILKRKIVLNNFEPLKDSSGKDRKLLRLIFISGALSVLFLAIIIFTLPYTDLSLSSLFVFSSIVSLVIFLFVLLFRYFSILVMAYLYITRYTVQQKNTYTPFVSIIVPVYNEGKVLTESIKSLLKLNYSNYEIIIVNDGSTDNTKQVAQSLVGLQDGLNSKVRISLVNKANGGKSRALNAGIQVSKGDFVLCMDGDSQLSPDTLKYGVSHFIDPAIGAVAGNVKVLNRKKFLTDLQSLEYLEGLNMPRSAQSFLKLVNIIPGPIGIFRKKAIQDAGWYASDTFAEDADLTLKILAAGWKIYYEPMAISWTEAPDKLNQLLKQRYRWTRGIIQSIRKHKKHLMNPTINFNNSLVLWSMFYESLIWPIMNIFANGYFIIVALFFGMSNLLVFWWAGLALLDLMTSLYCIAVEKEEVRLIPYAIVYRLFFILLIDITKFMATIEEFLGMQMTWGKLERIGTAKA
ncbi:MAG: glycosyltransferase [Ignavibacteriales bacterium]|nr:MAG: glycosyltransferase [Ignavibacteriales bacterium]